jgi:hypothetical protein
MLASARARSLGSFALAALASCGAGRTMILQPAVREYRTAGFTLQHSDSTAAVPAEVVSRFESKVRERAGKSGMISSGELLLRYRFIQFEEGDQFQRWFWGGIGNAGEGSLTCEVLYLDPHGAELAKIQCEGRIGSGFFGGTLNEALDRMAQEVAEYTVQHFARSGLAPAASTSREASSDE